MSTFKQKQERQHRLEFLPAEEPRDHSVWGLYLVVVCASQGQVLLALPIGCPAAHLLLGHAALAAAEGQAALASALLAA